MPSIEHQIQSVREAVGKSDPWTSGTIQVPLDSLDIFYLHKSDPPQSHHIKLTATASDEDLDKLTASCDRATFGREKEDVLDESYRKAGKLDLNYFTSKLDSRVIELIPKITPHLLKGEDSGRDVEAELYKLNVYDKGSFFRVHKDTPRSKRMFGSFVIVFPTLHTGGQLVLHHDGKELNFDSSTVISNSASPEDTVAYIAFFSDVEHEILPVTSGYRITLTYNLYFSESPRRSLPTRNSNKVSELKESLSVLLNNPQFLPKGGLLGFALSHWYPISPGSGESLDWVLDVLKGEDAVIRSACEDLDLFLSVKSVLTEKKVDEYYYSAWDHGRILLDYAVDFTKHGENGLTMIKHMLYEEGGTLIHPYDEKLCYRAWKDCTPSKAIAWITDLQDGRAGYKSLYIAFGNEPSPEFEYITLSLVAAFGPVGDRKNWSLYKAESE
ncbi:hypothetical protein E1B28_011913 [Marasmius oreades]|uniref:Fe2OG dioxygenase domain-containing protein n=1 Tax=Marasmius oreades TaxID=181124 RepID=A0A9P7URP7_9AGAR|nr:uncharacterized protein E1B28_011913 [Marasmius oreades]KAG7090316.1 hypothetical protein E1B28_011913 [Marasmius oreades]